MRQDQAQRELSDALDRFCDAVEAEFDEWKKKQPDRYARELIRVAAVSRGNGSSSRPSVSNLCENTRREIALRRLIRLELDGIQ